MYIAAVFRNFAIAGSEAGIEVKFMIRNKEEIKKTVSSWLWIFVGCTIMAAGFVYFINPYNIVPGGVYGASIVLHNLFPSLQVGTFGYMLDIPLMIISVLALGGKLGGRTIAAALTTPFIMNALSKLAYPSQEALERLDPAQLLGGVLDLSGHLLLTTVFGAVLIGIGCGIVVRNQATTGGSDIVAMIMQKYLGIPFSRGIFFVDGMVVCFGLVVIGFGVGSAKDVTTPSLHLMLYSLLAIFITSRVLAFTINGAKNDKLIFIISDNKMEMLRQYILKDLDRSATYMESTGLYSGTEKQILMVVLSNKEATKLKVKIQEEDPRAFVIVTDAYDAFGEGWKQLPTSAAEIQPE